MTIGPYYLSKGAHTDPGDGRCAMEWVAYVAGESHTDQPVCVDQPLKAFCIGLNDVLDDEDRQGLRSYLARCIGTAGDGRTSERGFLCLDWLVRTYTPTWLTLAGLNDDAARLRMLPEIVDLDLDSAKRAGPVVQAVQRTASAARDAAGDAAGDAAWVAAGEAAWAAARDAAGVAAREAAWVAAWVAAWAAARDAAWEAAWDAAWAAAGVAAWAAAWDAAGVAARDAAREALAPTVKELQRSAFSLLDRMLPLEPVQIPTRVEIADAFCQVPS